MHKIIHHLHIKTPYIISSSCEEPMKSEMEEDSSVAAKSVVKVEVGLGPLCRCFCLFGPRAAPIITKSKNKNNNSVIKVAAVCGSLRGASYNRCLIRSAIEISKASIDGLEIEYVDISALPFLNVDLEGKDGSFPPAVEAFRRKILEADSILFASPEYNYSISAPLKNAIDWASRPPNAWADKAAAVVSASGDFGGGRSQYHLRQVGVSLDLHFINKPEFFLDGLKSPEKFDSGNLVDEQDKERLKEILLALQAFTLRLQTK